MRQFHDAAISRLLRVGADIAMHIDDVEVYGDSTKSDGAKESGVLYIRGVRRLVENDVVTDAPTMAFDHGSILEPGMSDTGVPLLVEWQTFSPRSSVVGEYEIDGVRAEWQPQS